MAKTRWKRLVLAIAVGASTFCNAGAQAAPGESGGRFGPSVEPKRELRSGEARLGSLESSAGALAEVVRLDREARQAEKRDERTLRPTKHVPGITVQRASTLKKERRLDEALDRAWASLASPRATILYVAEPLRLATLELQVHLRRALGPSFRTEVPGLENDRGCDVDLPRDRLLEAYADIVASPLRTAHREAAEPLDAVARLAACLGARQLAELDLAMEQSFERVRKRLVREGLETLLPAFVRLIAPVQVALADVGKHRGAHAASYRFFEEYGDLLLDEVAYAGWATELLFVWDRRAGRLTGLPPCENGLGPDCFDAAALIGSLADPRALGRGGCAIGAMIAHGEADLAGDPRYTCPMRPCSNQPSAGPGGLGGLGRFGGGSGPVLDHFGRGVPPSFNTFGGGGPGGPLSPDEVADLEQRGFDVSGADANAMAGVCRGALSDFQTPAVSPEDCDIPAGEENPFDKHTACMVEAIGTGDPEIGGELRGVPRGPQCGLSGEDGDTPKPQASPKPKATPTPKESPEPAASPKPGKSPAPQSTPFAISREPGSVLPTDEQMKKIYPALKPLKPGKRRGYIGHDWEVATQEWEDDKGKVQIISVIVRGNAEAAKKYMEPKRWTESGAAAYKRLEAETAGGRSKGCLDPFSCGNSCTALGRQLNEASACNEDLLDAIAEAVGRPKKDLTRRLDIVSKPRPDQGGGDPSGLPPCIGGPGHPRPPAHCGLVLCSDGMPASPVGNLDGACVCGQLGGEGGVLIGDLCLSHRCADGSQPTGPDCRCGDDELENGELPPRPDPTRNGGGRPPL